MCHSKDCWPLHLHDIICLKSWVREKVLSLKDLGSMVWSIISEILWETRWWWLSNENVVALCNYLNWTYCIIPFGLYYYSNKTCPPVLFQMPLLTLLISFLAILSCRRKWPQKEFLGEKPRSSISEICSQSLYPNDWCLDKEVHRHSNLTE